MGLITILVADGRSCPSLKQVNKMIYMMIFKAIPLLASALTGYAIGTILNSIGA